MNLLVMTAAELFVRDPADDLQQALIENLIRLGIKAETIRMPITARSAERLIDDMVVCRSLQLLNVDRVIALRFPAYLVPHPEKVCWLVDHWSERYDTPNGTVRIPDSARGLEIRRLIEESDRECLGGLHRLFAASPLIREQVKASNGLDADVLPLPTDNAKWDETIDRLLS